MGLLASIRNALSGDGTYLVYEPALSPNVHENVNRAGRLVYGATALYCMTTSLAQGGAGIGSDMSEPLMRELAAKAGFARFRRVPGGDAFGALYELRA